MRHDGFTVTVSRTQGAPAQRRGTAPIAVPPSQASGRYYLLGSDRLFSWIAGGTLLSYIFEGPLRYALHLMHLETLLYLRDVAAVGALSLALLSWLRGQREVAPLIATLAILVSHCAIGVLTLPSAFQALFGLKVFLVFLLGFMMAPLIARQPQTVVRFASFALLSTALGVALNTFVEFPWVGLSYDTAFGTTVASRQWWTAGAGTPRLAGFARASFTAATIMVIALVPLLASARSLLAKLFWLSVTAPAMWLTTMKGAFTALAMFLIGHVMTRVFRSSQWANAQLLALAMFCLALPVFAVQVGTTGTVPDVLSSFAERVGDMWPRAFALLTEPGQWLWGRGLGGIGTAMEHGEWQRANSADNLMLYVLVTCGVLGLVYVAVFLRRLTRYLALRAPLDFQAECARGWTTLWLSYGFTAGMVDLPVMNLTAGMMFGAVFATDALEPSVERRHARWAAAVGGLRAPFQEPSCHRNAPRALH